MMKLFQGADTIYVALGFGNDWCDQRSCAHICLLVPLMAYNLGLWCRNLFEGAWARDLVLKP